MPDSESKLPAVATSPAWSAVPDGNGGNGGNGDRRGAAPAAVPALATSYDDEADAGIDWRRYLGVARRYKWWILGLMLLGAAGGVLATRFRAPQYMAQATIWIQQSETPRGGNAIRGPIGNDALVPSTGAILLVKSYVVLDDVVRQRRMYVHTLPRDRATLDSLTVGEPFQPGFYRVVVDPSGKTYRLEGAEKLLLEQGTVGDSIGRQFGILWAPSPTVLGPGADVEFSLTSLRDAAQGLASGLTVGVDQSGTFLRLTMVGADPKYTADIVNAVAERYIAVSRDLKRAKASELARLLDAQLAAAKENLRKAEDALATYRTRTITLAPDVPASSPASAATGDYFTLRLEAEQLRRDREAIDRVLASAHGDTTGGGIEALSYIGVVGRSPDLTRALQDLTTKRAELRTLRTRYTDDHPAMRKALDDVAGLEGRTIPSLARQVRADLVAREQALQPYITAGGRELQAVPQRAVDEARLRRDADLAAGIYASVQGRQSEARLAEASSVADVRLLDAAVPPRGPMKATDSRFIILGVLFGLGLGLVGAVVIDRMDPRVRYADQVTRDMGLRILGMLPHVKNRDAGPDDPQVAQLIEAMRSVRLNLMHAYGTSKPVVLTVTSPGVGDGKSFTSTNLAMACAQSGQRTLLIDGDARRGMLHRGLALPRVPGLTDVLTGRVPLEAAVQATRYRHLQFIAGGTRLAESPELLGSPAMLQLFAQVRPQYDVIVVDSPPLGAGVDPCILGTLTGSMVLVLRSGATHRDVARTHLAAVSHLPIRLLGVVLNDVGPAGMYAYYGYYYLAGYTSVDDAAEETAGVAVMARGEHATP